VGYIFANLVTLVLKALHMYVYVRAIFTYQPRFMQSKRPNERKMSKKAESIFASKQDRLYEIDKSWKNNLMIYGVPCAENMEEDSVITEEKVCSNMFCSNKFGSNKFGSNKFGSNKFGSNKFGSNKFGSNKFGSDSVRFTLPTFHVLESSRCS
jgi:hypothetical protein